MDPNNIQNVLGGSGGGNHGVFNNVPPNQGFTHNMAQVNAAGQYNPMLLPQSYINFPFVNYPNNQLAFDFQASQSQYLMQPQQQPMVQHQHQPQPINAGMNMLFNPQQQQMLQLMQQTQPMPAQIQPHQLQTQMSQPSQRPPQQIPPQQTQFQTAPLVFEANQMPSSHQKLFEEQCRQIEREKKEQEERKRLQEIEDQRKRNEEAKKQRILEEKKHAEEQQKIREQMERERLEEVKRMEEMARLEAERRAKEEREEKEREEMRKFAEEKLKHESELQQQRDSMETRFSQIPQPLTLVGTHFLPNFLDMIPFPYESLSESTFPRVFDLETNGALLNCCDPNMISTISNLLSSTNVDDIVTRMDKLRPEDKENNDLFLDKLPPIIRDVVNYSTSALDVDSHNDMELLENEDVMMAEDITRTASSVLVDGSSLHHSNRIEHHSTSSNNVVQSAPKAGKGKGKGKGKGQRKKRDMVENLIDSLTDNFVPTDTGRRGRRRQRGSDDEDDDLQRDLELIAAMEAGEKLPSSVTGFSADEENGHHFFDSRKRRKKEEKEKTIRRDRSPTPTDVIDARDAEWQERIRLKQERDRNRKIDDGNPPAWSLQSISDNDTFIRFCSAVDGALDQAEGVDSELMLPKKRRSGGNKKGSDDEEEEELDEIDPDLRIDLAILEELRRGSTRLRENYALPSVGPERLMKLITMLDRNMRDAISADNQRLLVPCEDDMEVGDVYEKEICEERVKRAVDAAVIALNVMSAHKMHKQVVIEDVIERSIGLARLLLLQHIYPASDSVYKLANTKKKDRGVDEARRRKKIGVCNRDKFSEYVYERITEMISLIADLVKSDSVPETAVHSIATISITPFFVSNVVALQNAAMFLAANIFARADEALRFTMIADFLSSLHRTPQINHKNTNNGYLLPDGNWISTTTALFIQLIQSTIKPPKFRKHVDEDDTEKRAKNEEASVKESFLQASKMTNAFLNGFLAKCSQKGNKMEGEEDYRLLFSNFLQELLAALYSPEWPATEMILTALGTLLVKNFRSKATDMTVRQASLDYLGNITARLRKDNREAIGEKRLDSVVKKALFLLDDKGYDSYESIDISEISGNEKLKILESSLIDYLIISNSSGVIIYACNFYVGEWYRETIEDLDNARVRHKEALDQAESDKESKKMEKRYVRLIQKGDQMKAFHTKLLEKKEIKRRLEKCSKVKIMDSDARWAVKFLAQSREFTHSFETYLKHIVFGAGSETIVALRSKALKCLSSIIEADSKVLILDDVQQAVHSRMVDSHAQVRESAVELIGRFVLFDEDYVRKYYNQIAERILDTGVAVRKRVIRIMREICEKYPSFEMIPDMLARMIRRVTDEDGVKKLVFETFTTLWFQPVDIRINPNAVSTKVTTMCSVAQHCMKDAMSDYLEMLILHIVKGGNDASGMSLAVKQIVDSLVDHILNLEIRTSKTSGSLTSEADLKKMKEQEEKYMAYLSTLAIFSKVRPNLLTCHVEVLLPYLTFSGNKTNSENQITKEMIGMLERVIPLIPYPSNEVLDSIDLNLSKGIMFNGMALVVSAISCAASIYHKFNRGATKTMELFNTHFNHLKKVKQHFDKDRTFKLDTKMFPLLGRSLFLVGVLSRHFSFEKILKLKIDDVSEMQVEKLKETVFVLLEFFSRYEDAGIRQKALTSLGHFCAKHSSYLTRKQLQKTYLEILQASPRGAHHPLRILVLQNLEMFLQSEEQKLAASHENWEENKDMQNLKEMELSGSGLGSSVIQKYWPAVLDAYIDASVQLRRAAVQVVHLTLNQGLVTPGTSIATLVAMTTDPVEVIRNRFDGLLKDIDSKYSGMVQSKAMHGVRLAYNLHRKLNEQTNEEFKYVRGFRFCDFHVNTLPNALPEKTHDGMAVLSGLYQSLRSNRQQRRSFLQSMVKLFSDEAHDKPNLMEYLFIADNLAMFPYQMIDEPLFVIRQIDQNVAQTGQYLLVQYKHSLQMREGEDEDVVFIGENLKHRLFEINHINMFHQLFLASQIPSILLYVRSFLMQLYGFNEAKVAEYLPSEAAKVYEKAVTRRNIQMFKPVTALEALHFPIEHGSFEHISFLAEKIASFRKMLLSLDQVEEVDVAENITTANQDDDYDEEEEILGEQETSHLDQ